MWVMTALSLITALTVISEGFLMMVTYLSLSVFFLFNIALLHVGRAVLDIAAHAQPSSAKVVSVQGDEARPSTPAPVQQMQTAQIPSGGRDWVVGENIKYKGENIFGLARRVMAMDKTFDSVVEAKAYIDEKKAKEPTAGSEE